MQAWIVDSSPDCCGSPELPREYLRISPSLLESAQLERPLIDQELLEILACPLDKAPVRLQGDRIVCTKCGRRYPIREGIPVMLIDEAELPA